MHFSPLFLPSLQHSLLPPQLVPTSIAPNILTFSGWLLLVSIFLLLSLYDWDYFTTSNDLGIQWSPIPQWVWLFAAMAHFAVYTLDGIDGNRHGELEPARH